MKSIVALSLVFFLSAVAHADDTSSGCGLGWQVTKRKSLVASSTRVTTNDIFYLQWFGMTSGTSGCRQHDLVQKEKAPLFFAEANYNNLMREMAEGHGEYLEAFAAVMGCNSAAIPTFSNVIQSNYPAIFNGNGDSPNLMLNRVKAQIHNNSKLASNCHIS